LKIWIDILTPKQLLFSEHIIQELGKNHDVFCTSRSYNEVSKLAQIRNFKLVSIGKFGGGKKSTKLDAHIDRMKKLLPLIRKFSPDLTISFCSPEAARISFGLGIKHVAFCDSPHAEAVMKLTLPLIQKLLIPWIIPKKEFVKYGIKSQDILQYKAIDASITIKRMSITDQNLNFNKSKKNKILIRMEEDQAAYSSKSSKIIPIIKKILSEFNEEDIIILGRYSEQIKKLKSLFGKRAQILKMSYDGKFLLENIDIFIGSGGTMTAEAALFGVPTISYNAVPNIVENFLVRNNLVKRESNPKKIVKIIKKYIGSSNDGVKKRANKISNKMEDPIKKLIDVI
jgi:predicted glycosyltransferase